MTNPPQGPRHPGGHDPSQWARPGHQPPAAAPTERLTPPAAPTERIAAQPPAPEPPTRHIPRQPGPATTPPPVYPTQPAQPQHVPAAGPADKESTLRRFVKDPLSITLVLVIVCAVGIAALLGGELYARKRADEVVAKVTQCVVQDNVTASFGVVPPFLWQHANGHYTNISIQTAGNQVRDAKGMKLDIDIKDVRLQSTANSAGTIGSLVATVDWTSDGIKQTVQNMIPLFGGIVSGVKTNASAGTIELDGPLGSVTAKPQAVNGALQLEVQNVTGLGFTLPRESVQPALDVFTEQLLKDYPMGIKADNVQVTDTGVTSQFSTQNATIPLNDQDPCFVGL